MATGRSATRATSPAGRRARCRPTSRPRSTTSSAKPPKAAMVIEGDFVPGVVDDDGEARSRTTTCSRSRRSAAPRPSVVGGGDIVVMFKDSPAQPGARQVPRDARRRRRSAAKRGGFSSPNKNVDAERLPGRRSTGRRRSQLANAKTFRFDMSDLQPAAFGGTVGQGEWKLFQDFLKTPTDVNGIAAAAGGGRRRRPTSKPRVSVSATRSRRSLPASGSSARRWPALTPARPAVASASSRRRSSCSASGSSTRRSTRSSAASSTATGDDFVGFDNYKTLFTTDIARRPRSRTTRSGSRSCPRS